MSDQLTPLAIAFSGALGAVVSNGIVYPLDTLKTRIQAKDASDETEDSESSDNTKYQVTDISNDLAHIPKNTLINGIIKLFKQEGIAAAYGGFGASMLNTFSQQFAYFYWYGAVRTAWIKSSKNNGNLSTVVELLIGAIAGDLAQVFTIPVNVIATRQQIGVQDGNTNATFFSVAKQIITDDGLTGLWRGLQPSLVLSVNPAITYGAYEKLKTAALSRHLSRSDGRMSPWANFFLGAMSKTAATIVTYPYIMAKVRVMAGTPVTWRSSRTIEQDKKELKKNTGALKLLMHIYKKRGIAGWYQGMHAQIVKAVLQQALLFVLRDIFEKYTLFGVLILRSLRSA
ncbi:Peroxisomal adenine nucleotide transporter 1 [Wallemia ichthyophaga EXF-994]|uniref:Peroxisomal adenine nucleotide transporter 1 n=1 Tax=Wallemia ichthyophaga (strain EXF-994 / CBS 113033) TaxID=1299270 RepID=R9AG72_WALI9|nr:Peroxisomal adenine nucleotide transporter 1 [Wallemia ichthyophaga EXF-994]EOR01193.1 Peroxisomal adenine nucleotide transporter 1 [Wallemia ichthyophaga EXF-994]